MNDNPRIVSTDEFWQAMCRPSFCRLARNKGVINDTGEVLFCATPPEDVPGFVEARHRDVAMSLGIDWRRTFRG